MNKRNVIITIISVLILTCIFAYARTTTTDLQLVKPTWTEGADIIDDINTNSDILEAFANDPLEFDTGERLEDRVGALLGGTETLITVTYDEAGNAINFIVNNDLSLYSNATSAFITNAELAAFTGSANIVTLGTIGTGVWQGTAIADGYIPDDITITESDPNALLTAGTDNVKDTHIDWGVGATQVSGADLPVLGSAYTVDNAFDAGLRNGVYSGLTVTDVSGINISWTSGVAFVNGSVFAVDADASEDIADNATTYLYVLKDNATMQESTTEPTVGLVGEFALVCILHTYDGDIHEKFDFPLMSGALRYDVWKFLDKITPTACASGCNVSIDTEGTYANDFKVATGTYYTDVLNLNTISGILYSSLVTHNGTNVIAYYHTGSAWTSGAEAGINFSQWDNGVQKTSTAANKWYTGWVYIEDGDTLIYVYPQTEHASEGAALDEAAQYPPYHEGIVLPSAKFIFRSGESAFGARAYFIDIRPFFGYGDGATAQMIYQTVTGDSGTTTATASDDSLAIVGGGIATTAVTADTVTVTVPAADDTAYDATSWDANTGAATKNAIRDKIETLGSGGYTNLTSFIDQTAWRLFYSNTDGDVTELALGTDGQVLTSNGVAVAPTFEDAGGAGETNTASNIGSEVEIFKQKDGVDLEFRTLKANSDKITINIEIPPGVKDGNGLDNLSSPFVQDASTERTGQYWTTGSAYEISSIKAMMGKSGSPGTVVLSIYAVDVDHKPTGAALTTGSINATLLTDDSAEEVTFTLTPYSLSSFTEYAWVLSGTSLDGANKIYVYSADALGDAAYVGSTDSGSSWTINDSYDLAFETYGELNYLDYIEIDIVPSEIALDALGATTDITTLNSSTIAHGLMPKLPFSGDLLSTTTVAFNAGADTTLYTVPTGKRCILTYAIVVAAGDAGATTTLSIGQDTAETDFLPANTLSNLDAQYDSVILQPIPNTTPLKIKSYAAATVIQAQVASQSGVAGNTIYLFGITY